MRKQQLSSCPDRREEERERERGSWLSRSQWGVRRVGPDGRVFQTNDERRTEARENRRLRSINYRCGRSFG